MAPHISQQIRDRIVAWHEEGILPEEIAHLAGCSIRSVFYILAYHRDFATTCNPFVYGTHGRIRSLDIGDINYISSLLNANPKLFLDEIQESLMQYRQREASISTLSRALRHIQITHKKVATAALERNELLRAIWQAEYGGIAADYCIWLDESSVDNMTNIRRSGWSELGQACVSRDTFIRGQRFSILPALSPEGIVALDIFEGSVNKDCFIRFLNEQLVNLSLWSNEFKLIASLLGSKIESVSRTIECRHYGQLHNTS